MTARGRKYAVTVARPPPTATPPTFWLTESPSANFRTGVVIDARRKHPFNLEVSSADLVNVTDISVQRSGILRTMLDYGDIICQTAGTGEHTFKLGGLPHPREVQMLIDKERDRERLRVRGIT